MSTFVMKEDTTIVLDIATEHKSKIKMLAGNFWINFKKIWTDGSMEIEMSQAVCGIKATTLIIEETDYVSTLKVLEGEVEFTSKATGEVEYVGGGQMISADAYGLGEIEPFDIEEEMKGWHETARQITANEINKKSRRGVFITIGLVLALGIIASVIIVVLRHERSRKLSPVPTIAPYYVPRHCSRCGNSVPPASKYCPFCSAPLVAPYTAPRHCSRCGKTLPPGGKFCPICGAPVPVPLRIHTGRF
jgi:RNA polymerase subunit RPABC4/transcription elongation factor Spt4